MRSLLPGLRGRPDETPTAYQPGRERMRDPRAMRENAESAKHLIASWERWGHGPLWGAPAGSAWVTH